MEKPKWVREERRNGVGATIFFDRFAIPSGFLAVVVLLGAAAMIAGMFLSKPLGEPLLMLPALIFVAIFIASLVGRLIVFIVKQFIAVNRKDLGDG